MANIANTADILAQALNDAPGGTFNQAFTPERLWLPLFNVQALNEVKVSVVHRGLEAVISDRAKKGFTETHEVEVAVQKKLEGQPEEELDNEEPDGLIQLAEEIGDYVRQLRVIPDSVPSNPVVVYQRHNVITPEDDDLRQKLFTAVVQFTFKLTGGA